MKKVKVFIAVSLDGYITYENESLEWLFNVVGEGDNGYQKFYDTVDTVVMGRTTYNWIMREMPSPFPYIGKDTIVVTRHELLGNPHVRPWTNSLEDLMIHLKEKANKDIWIVGGGKLISSLINEQLIDEIIVTIAPVILGKGIKLFEGISQINTFKLVDTKRYGNFVEIHYKK